jgi:hypothetical protein
MAYPSLPTWYISHVISPMSYHMCHPILSHAIFHAISIMASPPLPTCYISHYISHMSNHMYHALAHLFSTYSFDDSDVIDTHLYPPQAHMMQYPSISIPSNDIYLRVKASRHFSNTHSIDYDTQILWNLLLVNYYVMKTTYNGHNRYTKKLCCKFLLVNTF